MPLKIDKAMSDYNSFLVCIRDTHVDVYQNVLKLGITMAGVSNIWRIVALEANETEAANS